MRIGAYNLTPESTNVNWVSLSLLLDWIIMVVVKKELSLYIYHGKVVAVQSIHCDTARHQSPPII